MAAVISNINQNQARAMQVAVRRIEGFAKQFGEAHRNLARHAAFPLALTPDLLYQIWANFVPEAPWTAVAHVLLSRLCRQVGYEMYEMDIADRNLLLRELKEQFGQERLDELGEFLLNYVAQRLTEDDPDIQDLREAQEWTALAYTKPDQAARELAQTLSQRMQQEDMGEVLRLASLVETLTEPLVEAGFEPLLVYSRGIKYFAHGDLEEATAQVASLLTEVDTLDKVGSEVAISTLIKFLENSDLSKSVINGDNQLSKLLFCLYEKLEKEDFVEFINENYDEFEDVERLLFTTYNKEYLDFESFVDLAIQTLKPDFDGKVYVKYNRYYSTRDEGERYVGFLGQQAVQIHLSQVPEFITDSDGESLGVYLEQEQEIEMVLAILNSGEYELPDADIENGTVEIYIEEPELFEDSYEEDEIDVDFEEPMKSNEFVELDDEEYNNF